MNTPDKNYSFLDGLTKKILQGGSVSQDDARHIIYLRTQEELVMLLAFATVLRNHFKGDRIDLCAVVNAKSGRCAEDCLFCAQSAHYRTEITTYPLLDKKEILSSAGTAQGCSGIPTASRSYAQMTPNWI